MESLDGRGAENPGTGAAKGPWGAVRACLGGRPNSDGLDRFPCPTLSHHLRILFPGSAQEEAVKTKNDGQYVQCSLENEAAQSSQAAFTPQALPGF